ncbi:MAG: hypothetical protein SGI86_06405 [Deltaproteobacteria bacterium]|nr:hypothetical protein [Deltaproteobacteria bacterium]
MSRIFTHRNLLATLLPVLLASGCAASAARAPWPFQAPTRAKGVGVPPSRAAAPADPRADMVERALQSNGQNFGTDGTLESVYAYAVDTQTMIPAHEARTGDVLFFDTTEAGTGCGSHAGVVDSVRPGGSLGFREYRGGKHLRSVVAPNDPRRRRDSSGRIVNTYLRTMTRDDPAGTRYTAAEMLCRVVRIR